MEIFHGGLPVTVAASVLQQIPQADMEEDEGVVAWGAIQIRSLSCARPAPPLRSSEGGTCV